MTTEAQSSKRIAAYQNRCGAFATALEVEMARAARYSRPLGLIHFKVECHVAGKPEQIAYIATVFENLIRKIAESVFRITDFWGALEENGLFAALIETDSAGALRARERILDHPEFVELQLKHKKHFTFTIGCAEFKSEMLSVDEFAAGCRNNVATVLV